ncbi:MAG: hypothetical protein GAK31_00038 [Stenotrophomonas maltophilia]|uniref:GNAT family N-acetyltransferase n=1 Tax=Stenotrophomonas maltophilia TaxID=40324 RepID=A0A7V8JMV2_STEMA|nr:MAG: hypothetical protein GAK31_00038 [Stenotrophomonas maltophilia]
MSSIASPSLRPVLGNHLLQLRHASTLLRPLQRSDLPAWRALYEHALKRTRQPYDANAEYRFLPTVQRSRLQHAGDTLLLGAFDAGGTLLGLSSVQLQCTQAHRAELHWACEAALAPTTHLASALLALNGFLFQQVGLRRVVMLLSDTAQAALVEALLASGYHHEAILRDHHRDSRGWHDRWLYALTAPAWQQHPASQDQRMRSSA